MHGVNNASGRASTCAGSCRNWNVILLKHQARVAAALGEPAALVIVDGSGFPKNGPELVGVAPNTAATWVKLPTVRKVSLPPTSARTATRFWMLACICRKSGSEMIIWNAGAGAASLPRPGFKLSRFWPWRCAADHVSRWRGPEGVCSWVASPNQPQGRGPAAAPTVRRRARPWA